MSYNSGELMLCGIKDAITIYFTIRCERRGRLIQIQYQATYCRSVVTICGIVCYCIDIFTRLAYLLTGFIPLIFRRKRNIGKCNSLPPYVINSKVEVGINICLSNN